MLRRLLAFAVLCPCSSAPRSASEVGAPPHTAPAPANASALDPPKPALRLPRDFLPTAYRARLALDPASAGFHGAIEIDGELRQRSKGIWLHGRGLKVTAAHIARADKRPSGKAIAVDVAAVGD